MPDELGPKDPDEPEPRATPRYPPPEMVAGLVEAVIQEVRVSPMPDLEYINGLSERVPDAAERFLRVYERVGENRDKREMARIQGQLQITRRGQWIGGVLVATIVILGAALQYTGSENAWVAAVSIPTLGIATAFLGGKFLDHARSGDKAE